MQYLALAVVGMAEATDTAEVTGGVATDIGSLGEEVMEVAVLADADLVGAAVAANIDPGVDSVLPLSVNLADGAFLYCTTVIRRLLHYSNPPVCKVSALSASSNLRMASSNSG